MVHATGSEASDDHRRARGWRDAGATLVEYSLVFALILVPSIGAVNYLRVQGTSQINQQGECVSMRPPPTTCQLVALTTTTTLVPPSITSTTAPPPPNNVAVWASSPASTWNSSGGSAGISVTVQITQSAVALPGATVYFRVSFSPGGYSALYPASVVTNAQGKATLTLTQSFLNASYGSATSASVSVYRVDDPVGLDTTPPAAAQVVNETPVTP